MENATKALTMAGGVLIGVMILSIIAMYFNSAGRFNSEYDSHYDNQEILEFNSKYESYNRKNLTYFDIITVCNLAWDNNQKFGWDNPKSKIEVKMFYKSEEYTLNKEKNEFLLLHGNKQNFYDNDFIAEICTLDENGNYKNSFKCTECLYYESTGKIKSMTFIQN